MTQQLRTCRSDGVLILKRRSAVQLANLPPALLRMPSLFCQSQGRCFSGHGEGIAVRLVVLSLRPVPKLLSVRFQVHWLSDCCRPELQVVAKLTSSSELLRTCALLVGNRPSAPQCFSVCNCVSRENESVGKNPSTCKLLTRLALCYVLSNSPLYVNLQEGDYIQSRDGECRCWIGHSRIALKDHHLLGRDRLQLKLPVVRYISWTLLWGASLVCRVCRILADSLVIPLWATWRCVSRSHQ